MTDPFKNHARGLESPGTRHMALAPSDSEDLPLRPRVVFCLGDGTAVLRDEAGADVTYDLMAGQLLAFSPVRLLATGTTATLVGWW